jgi:type I restriction enzyme S subunit
MELMEKHGFKQTEVGLIPEDWSLKEFKEIFKVNQGLQIAIEERKKHPTEKSKKYITIQYLNDGKIVEYIDDFSESVCCNEDDILMTRTGNTGMVITNVNGVFHNNFFKINFDRKKLDRDYIVYFLRQRSTQKRILDKAGTSTIPDLNHNDFYALSIPLPPVLSEQKAIATALSVVDELISNLDQLINKKKAIKQGAMQQLLTPPHKGGKRLEGFTGDWEEKKMGECLKYEQPTKYIVKNANYEGQSQTPVLTAGKTFLLGFTDEKEGIYSELPVIIFDDFTTSKQYVDFEFKVKSSAMKMLKATSETDINFIYSTMNMINFSLGDDHKRRWIAEYSKITIFVPEIQEQKAISEILSDMDLEIEQLESKKAKYQSIKHGMMQELLTGKTRLA